MSSDDEPPELVPVASAPHRGPASIQPAGAGPAPPGEHAAEAAAGAAAAGARPPVPVALITGFLGAGKSTLVNYILTAKHGYRCAVLLNEWADSADIERALIKEPEVGGGWG